MEYTVLEWNSITNQRRAVIESPHSWNPTELIVTAIPHESHLTCDSNKHINRYQSEWRRHIALPVMTKRNACDYWMGDVSISNGFGEWTGPAIPTILNNWFHLRLDWPLCEYLHRDDGLSNDDEWDVWHKGVTCLSVIIWTCVEELRCLFVREGWSEYCLGLWRQSCTRMQVEDTHWWDWACLNIIHNGWESLSRVMWRGEANVKLRAPLPLSVLSLGKSSQSIHIHESTSHYQCAWFVIIIEHECMITQLNGGQFRQV